MVYLYIFTALGYLALLGNLIKELKGLQYNIALPATTFGIALILVIYLIRQYYITKPDRWY